MRAAAPPWLATPRMAQYNTPEARAALLRRTLPDSVLDLDAREVFASAGLSNTDRKLVSACLRLTDGEAIRDLFDTRIFTGKGLHFAHAILDAIEKNLAPSHGWVPAAAARPRPAAPSAPTPVHRPVAVRPGMSREAWVLWGEQTGCSDLLALPTAAFGNLDLPAGHWCHSGQYIAATLLDVVSATPAAFGASYSRPPRVLADALVERLTAIAATPAPPPALAPSGPGLGGVWSRLRGLSGPLPDFGGGSFRVALAPADAVLGFRPTLPSACGAGPTTDVSVNLDAPENSACVTCNCRLGLQWCRTRAAAASIAADLLANPDRSPEVGRPLIERLAMPSWRRRLAALDASLPSLSEPAGLLGWAVDGSRDFALFPVSVQPKVRGGNKITKLTNAAVAAWLEEPLDRADRTLLDLSELQLLRADLDPRVRLPYFSLLAGHPRVFAWDQDRAPLSVVEEPLSFEMETAADGGVRLMARVGGESMSVSALQVRAWGIGQLRAMYADQGRTLALLTVGPEAARLLADLRLRGDSFPAPAVSGLLERLPRIARSVPVRISPTIDAPSVSAPTAPEVQLELVAGRGLALALRARPHAKAAAELPGEGSETIPVMTDEGIVIVRRDLPGEQAAAQRVAARLGLNGTADTELLDPDTLFDALDLLKSLPPDEARVAWKGRPPTLLREGKGSDLKVQVGAQGDWFGLRGTLEVEDAQIPLTNLLAAMRDGRRWIAVEGDRWVRLEETLRKRLAAVAAAAQRTRGKDTLSASHAPSLSALGDAGAEVTGPPRWVELVDRLRSSARLQPRVPAALTAELRPYQVEGFQWLTRLLSWAGGAVLADDMGLGKTVQALAVLVDRQSLGVQMVVAPTSVGFNWVREARRFAPSLQVHFHHGGDRPDELSHLGPGHLVITTYDVLVRDAEVLVGPFATLVVDEAQAVKNHETQRARTVAAVKADARIALSGTPVENRLAELWSLFHIVVPGFFGSWTDFRGRWAIPVERNDDRTARAALAGMVRPFILRRLKSEVARELPPRIEVRVDVELDAVARRHYEAVRTATLAAIGNPDPAERTQLRFKLLAALTRLRQLACDPGLVDPAYTGTSAKLDRLVELLEELRGQGRRALVFSQFSELLGRAHTRLQAAGFACGYLDGSTPAGQRAQQIDQFQAGGADVFLLSLKAGGTGLNLTAASDVVLLEPWWNPAVEDQAADRAHRIGQRRTVTIYRLVALATLEEQVLAMHARKRDLASAVLDGTGNAGAIDVSELLSLLEGAGPVS